MTARPIRMVVPEPDFDPGDKPVTPLFISPEGADPDREVPGFFVIQINGEYVWPDGKKPESGDGEKPPMPRQFLSLDAAYMFLKKEYGWKTPMAVTSYVRTETGGRRDFPAIWGGERRLLG